jgi:hypothetical protein
VFAEDLVHHRIVRNPDVHRRVQHTTR